jgi:hypothetical protein
MKNRILLFVTILPALFSACTNREPGGAKWRGQWFQEVRSIRSLPVRIQNALGVGKPGLDGIADRGGKFNATDRIDSSLPQRRFILAGLSSDSVLVVVAHGGRGYHVQASLFLLASGDASPGEIWTLANEPESLDALAKQLDRQQPD